MLVLKFTLEIKPTQKLNETKKKVRSSSVVP